MDGKLPRGAFKGLAKILGPLSLWMIAGWAAYPIMYQEISQAAGEVIDLDEIRLLSYAMVLACAVAGIILIIYGYTGTEPNDRDIVALNERRWPCPHCLTPQPANAGICEKCGKYIEK